MSPSYRLAFTVCSIVEMSRDLGTSPVLLRFLRCVEKTECVCVVELLEFGRKIGLVEIDGS